MEIETFVNRLADDGIAEVKLAYPGTEPMQTAKRDGCIAGFEACRGKNKRGLIDLLAASRKVMHEAMVASMDTPEDADARSEKLLAYWRARSYEAQVEWVCNVVSCALMNAGDREYIVHPTAHGMTKAAQVLGVSGQ